MWKVGRARELTRSLIPVACKSFLLYYQVANVVWISRGEAKVTKMQKRGNRVKCLVLGFPLASQ